ncbi:MAG: tRNA (guanosine(37)-N1)-methyltransferase TrmD [Gemmatimonadetes bacterium]|nr:tRNA (guanosine(37)-N1)-methyltransferase TrmD [Gemmatimonadota bacterium]
MRIDILTAFPGVFAGPFGESIVGRACRRDMVDIFIHDLRAFTTDRHKTIDDYAYGGSPGMVLKPEPIFRGVRHIRRQADQADQADQANEVERAGRSRTVLLSARGRPFVQETARSFAELGQLVLICGHYKGVDERVATGLGAEEYSVGDFVVTGGEIPAMMIADAVVRLIPGALGEPENYQEWRVPEVLLSGHHERIERWERQDALKKTFQHRPELLETVELTGEDVTYLKTLQRNGNGRH